ncbi:hypothetical protein PLIIFM63780_008081 [Purpureocillium lilacinum]|nr:hypothetical protein PLIIFM63780_008081 [Purpureocillium lilacinum]
MGSTLSGTDSLACPFVIPSPDKPLSDILPRWTESNLSHPAILLTPKNEDHIVAAIRVAKQNGLNVVPAGGRHGAFVAIDSKTALVELREFKAIDLDKANGTVRVGAGVLTGELLKLLIEEGYYTTLPNSNAVSIIGGILGGGNTAQNGLHGFMVDNVVSFRVITADGHTVEVSASSSGDELALFNALCGVGHGLGVVTAATMKVYPVSSLRLTDNKVWSRLLMFPPPALDAAVDAFLSFDQVAGPLTLTIMFVRSPPGTPAAGSPIILIAATYYGPADEAEKAAAKLLDEAVVSKAFKADTIMVPLPGINNGMEPNNALGGFKAMNSARLKQLTPETIKQSFAKWVEVTTEAPDAARTAALFIKFSPDKMIANGNLPEHKGKYFEGRDRGATAIALPWCATPASKDKLDAFVDEFLDRVRKVDTVPPRTFANTMRFGATLDELVSKERVAEVKKIKASWDPEEVFWNPYSQRAKSSL